jgi:hypothetical protein
LPYIYFQEKHQKKIETAEEKLPGILHGLSDLIAGGLTLQEALTEISKDSLELRSKFDRSLGPVKTVKEYERINYNERIYRIIK